MYLPSPPRSFRRSGTRVGEFDELVIEKRHAAFDGGGHAHLVLLHEQLDQVGLLVGVEHAGQQGESRLASQ